MREFWNAGIDLLFPRFCFLCRSGVEGPREKRVCARCEERMEFIGATACFRCGAWYSGGDSGECPECAGKHFVFRRAVAVGRYTGTVRDLILALKYARAGHLAAYLGALLADRVRSSGLAGEVQAVVPVPMGRWKTWWRGYNQSELLARHAGTRLGLPVVPRRLAKVRRTPPQQSIMHRDQRRANVRGAFAVRRASELKGRAVLLVDDVLTTGATANECTAALLGAGAREVYVAVVGR